MICDGTSLLQHSCYSKVYIYTHDGDVLQQLNEQEQVSSLLVSAVCDEIELRTISIHCLVLGLPKDSGSSFKKLPFNRSALRVMGH